MKKKQRNKADQAEEAEINARFAPVVEAFAKEKGVRAGKLFWVDLALEAFEFVKQGKP